MRIIMIVSIKTQCIVKRLKNHIFIYENAYGNKALLSEAFQILLGGAAIDTNTYFQEPSSRTQFEKLVMDNQSYFDFENNSAYIKYANKPKLDERFDSILHDYFIDNPSPWNIIIETTTNCNLKCTHCYNYNDKTFISIEKLKKFYDLLPIDKHFNTILTGGEVFSHPQIDDILKYLYNKEILIDILTNGTLLTKKRLANLSKEKIGTIQLSLYSTDPKMHDKMTGVKGSWSKTIATINELLRLGFRVSIASLVTTDNYTEIENLVAFARLLNIKINFCFNIVANCKDAYYNDKIKLSDIEYTTAYSKFLEIINSDKLATALQLKYDKVCLGGFSKFTIGANGDLFICPMMKNYPICNIDDIKSFDDFWYNEKLLKIRNMSYRDFEDCEKCDIKYFCHPCMADNYNTNKSLVKNNSYRCVCEHKKIQLEKELIKTKLRF